MDEATEPPKPIKVSSKKSPPSSKKSVKERRRKVSKSSTKMEEDLESPREGEITSSQTSSEKPSNGQDKHTKKSKQDKKKDRLSMPVVFNQDFSLSKSKSASSKDKKKSDGLYEKLPDSPKDDAKIDANTISSTTSPEKDTTSTTISSTTTSPVDDKKSPESKAEKKRRPHRMSMPVFPANWTEKVIGGGGPGSVSARGDKDKSKSKDQKVVDINLIDEKRIDNLPKNVQKKLQLLFQPPTSSSNNSQPPPKLSLLEVNKNINLLWDIVCWLHPDLFVNVPNRKHNLPTISSNELPGTPTTNTSPTSSPTTPSKNTTRSPSPPKRNDHEMDRKYMKVGESKLKKSDAPLKKRFKRSEQSGSGSFGTTYVVNDVVTQKDCVIKKMSHTNNHEKARNLLEIGVLSSCDHPNIVKYYDSFLNDEDKKKEEIWLVMENMGAGTLQNAARACRLQQNHVAFIAREILKALDYLHSQSFVHRDLKSTNIMLTIDGNVKLIDFGLCVNISNGPRYGIVGTSYWIAPEMFLTYTHDCSADIWSFGVCVMELFLTEPPYYPSPLCCIFKSATTGILDQLPSNTDSSIMDFMKKCLTQDPQKRATAKELLDHPWVNQPKLSKGIVDALDAIFLSKQLASFMPM
eukprot:TRINITY_DN7589_c0_g1_i1.p1 TRINITY_DN7589_c0_g1~~TRINITY_DN7589_c0_g1_i1.p1  ORF type:complete len:725 (+),score=168.33 TRINITY_DN7589_c0_g1_i1:279-2177(+)